MKAGPWIRHRNIIFFSPWPPVWRKIGQSFRSASAILSVGGRRRRRQRRHGANKDTREREKKRDVVSIRWPRFEAMSHALDTPNDKETRKRSGRITRRNQMDRVLGFHLMTLVNFK